VPPDGKNNADTLLRSGMTGPETGISVTPTLTGKLIFFLEWCKRCGLCTMICPSGALAETADRTPHMADPDRCTLCSLCWRICPDFAVLKNPNFEEEKEAKDEDEEKEAKEAADVPAHKS
jgi:ferredoxin